MSFPDDISRRADSGEPKMEASIRPMEARDLDAVSLLEERSFSMPWSRKELAECLEKEFYSFYVAEQNGELLGYIGYYRVFDEADIATVAVAAEARRRGIGESLMEVALTEAGMRGCTVVTLEVRDSNAPAIHLYEKLGFRQVGLRKEYYQHPTEDARIYALALEK